MTLLQQVLDNALMYPDVNAFCYLNEESVLCNVTYREVLAKVEECRRKYLDQAYSRIGIISTNSIEMLCNIWGAMATGKTVALLDPLMSIDDIIGNIKMTELDLIIRSEDIAEIDSQLYENIDGIKVVELVKDSSGCENIKVDELNKEWKEGEIILFTSGTSANSKGVVSDAIAVYGSKEAHEKIIYFEQGELTMVPVPLHHGFGFAITNFYFGARALIFITTMKSLARDMKKVQPRVLAIVPSGAEFLLKKKMITSELHAVILSGSYCSVELAERIREHGVLVQNRYGSSEIACAMGENLVTDQVDTLTLHDYISVEIADDGEAIMHTPYHFKEYYNRPEETAAVLDGDTIHTGDIGFLDENGKLHLQGRRKNMILLENGEKVLVQEIEDAIASINGVAESTVLYMDSKLIAVIKLEDEFFEEQAKKEIDKYNESRTLATKIKKIWYYKKEFPYTSSGKLLKRKLEEEYVEASINR